MNRNKFSIQYRAFLSDITTGVEPNTFAEAIKDNKWKDAIKK